MKEVYKCQYCNREFTRLVNKNMHEKYCQKAEPNNKNEKIIKKEKPIKKDTTCSHDFVLLDDRSQNQKQAISQGYNAYCLKCKELV